MRTRRKRALAGALALVSSGLLYTSLHASPDGGEAVAVVQAQLGDLLYSDARFKDASLVYEQAYQRAGDTLRTRVGQQWVKSLLRIAEFRRARSVASDVVGMAGGSAEAVALEADALWASGLFDEAEQRYADARAIDPDSGRAHAGLARSLLSRSQPDEALAEALAAVRAVPDEPEYHNTLGITYMALRRYEEAAASLVNFVNLLPYKDSSEKTMWARQHIRFLRSFGTRTPVKSRNGSAERVHHIPFKIERDKVIVQGRINGDRYDLVLDTGAEMTTVTKPVAEKVGLKPEVYTLSAGVGSIGMRGLMLGRVDRLQVGTLDVENVPTLIKNPPLVGMPTNEQESFNPIALGYSVTIDYRNRMLTIAKALPPMDEGRGLRLPMRLHRLALVRGVINRDNPAPFILDTGGEVISLSKATADFLQLEPPRRIALKVYGNSGWDPDAFLMPGLHLSFEQVNLENQSVVVLNLDAPSALLGFEVGGIVGHRFLSKYRVTMDIARSMARLD